MMLPCAGLETADFAPLAVSCARRCAAGLLRPGRSSRIRPGNRPFGGTLMLTTAQAGHFTTFGFAVWRDWLGDAAAHPARSPVIGRMRRAGVLDLPGAK